MAISKSYYSAVSSERFEQERLEAERKRDIILLLENLSKSQEATIKIILDCLYDVGSVRLINKKCKQRTLKGVMKWVAQMSKPAFRTFAFRWFKKNCPELITNWLYTKVSFENSGEKKAQETQPQSSSTVDIQVVRPEVVPELELAAQEIHRLRSQVKWLRGISIGAIATLGITLVWVSQNFQLSPNLQQTESAVLEICNFRTGKDCD